MANSRLERIGTIFTRRQGNEKLVCGISSIISQLESDVNALKDDERIVEKLNVAHLKFIKQSIAIHEQRKQALTEIKSSFIKQVEGFITGGALKADDRPIWFDVYKRFPPMAEPKFSRPKPESTPIRQIFYSEDIVRAKFHGQGYRLGAVNMLNPNSETMTKKLLQQYEQLKAEGVPEDQIIEKCVAAVENERRKDPRPVSKMTDTVQPQSVTKQVLAEVDIKNMFKEEK